MWPAAFSFVTGSLPEAIDALESDPVIQSALGFELAAEFVRVKRQEWAEYHNCIVEILAGDHGPRMDNRYFIGRDDHVHAGSGTPLWWNPR